MTENVRIYTARTQKHRGENGRKITHQNHIENAQHSKWQNRKNQTIKWHNSKCLTLQMIDNAYTIS